MGLPLDSGYPMFGTGYLLPDVSKQRVIPGLIRDLYRTSKNAFQFLFRTYGPETSGGGQVCLFYHNTASRCAGQALTELSVATTATDHCD